MERCRRLHGCGGLCTWEHTDEQRGGTRVQTCTDVCAYGPPGMCRSPALDVIYAHSNVALYTFSASTGAVTEVGPFAMASGEQTEEMVDLAVDAAGTAFVTSRGSRLYRVDGVTAVATLVGDLGIDSERLFALSFLPPEESPDGTEMLVGATNTGEYYQVDTSTGQASFLGRYSNGEIRLGDIVSVAGFGTYAVAWQNEGADVIVALSFSSEGSTMDIRGSVRDAVGTSYSRIFGLAASGGRLYGFNELGQRLDIDPQTGSAAQVGAGMVPETFWGAGVSSVMP